MIHLISTIVRTSYEVDKSLGEIFEVGDLNCPFRGKPGEFVELNTTSAKSLLILSLKCAISFLTASIKALIFLCISSGVNPN
jgi:hypothetical protein